MNPTRAGLLIPLLLAASPPKEPDAAPVIAAERAFAQSARTGGTAAAFRASMADDALMLAPEPTPAKALIGPDAQLPPSLAWWPAYAGIARSGGWKMLVDEVTADPPKPPAP